MAETVTKSRQTETVDNRDEYVQDPQTVHKQNVAVRVIWFIAGVLLTLLAFRFVLSLLGANESNGFANFIYTVSHPFVAPFFGLFNYDFQAGRSSFELSTLVAMAVYAIVAAGLARLATITRD